MYTVKCIAPNGANLPRTTNPYDETSAWTYGEVGTVEDAMIGPYNLSTDSFTVVGRSGTLVAADGLEAVSGLTAVDSLTGVVHQTTFTLADVAQAVVNGTEYQGTQLFTFPEARILVLGATMTIAQKTTSAILGTLNGESVGALSFGTVEASSTTLNSTMADIIPSTAFASSATINVAGTAVSSALAASAQFDGTTTPVELWVNTAYATTGDVDADATQTLSGHITVTWVDLADY